MLKSWFPVAGKPVDVYKASESTKKLFEIKLDGYSHTLICYKLK
jgi:hypothetical protein